MGCPGDCSVRKEEYLNKLIMYMEEINYKERDRKLIMDFLAQQGGMAQVEAIEKLSGAEPLRLYSLLFEEKMAGHIVVTKEDSFGAPVEVKLV